MIDLSPQKEISISDEQAKAFEAFMRRKRIEAGYPRQQDAATAIGVSQDLISRLESRFTPNVRVGEFMLVLKAYGITPNEACALLGLYETVQPPPEADAYIEREIKPLLVRLNMNTLELARRLIVSVSPNK